MTWRTRFADFMRQFHQRRIDHHLAALDRWTARKMRWWRRK